jgi:hypothetical protein
MPFDTEVLAAARHSGVRLMLGSPLRWLTPRGHLDPYVQSHASAEVLDVLDDVHASLGGNRRALARKVGPAPTPDFVVEASGQLVEIDEVQHFTAARKLTLGRYPTRVPFGFSLDDYRTLIETWKAKAHSVFTARSSADFDFVGGRHAQRAYYDAVKDLLAPTFTGLAVLRLPAPDRDVDAAVGALVARLA